MPKMKHCIVCGGPVEVGRRMFCSQECSKTYINYIFYVYENIKKDKISKKDGINCIREKFFSDVKQFDY